MEKVELAMSAAANVRWGPSLLVANTTAPTNPVASATTSRRWWMCTRSAGVGRGFLS